MHTNNILGAHVGNNKVGPLPEGSEENVSESPVQAAGQKQQMNCFCDIVLDLDNVLLGCRVERENEGK
jgi:hypothetical protein